MTGANADFLVSTSFKRPKDPVFTNFGFETELTVSSNNEDISDDEIGLKPMRPVLYSSRLSDQNYVSVDNHDPRGMEHLYTVTEMFLNLIQSEDIPPGMYCIDGTVRNEVILPIIFHSLKVTFPIPVYLKGGLS